MAESLAQYLINNAGAPFTFKEMAKPKPMSLAADSPLRLESNHSVILDFESNSSTFQGKRTTTKEHDNSRDR